MKMQSDELCQSVPKIDHWYLDALVFYKMGGSMGDLSQEWQQFICIRHRIFTYEHKKKEGVPRT